MDTLDGLATTSDTGLGVDLEELFEESLRCECSHDDFDSLPCTLEVVAIRMSCAKRILICAEGVRWTIYVGLDNCFDCGRQVKDCWKVIPI